MKGGNKLGKVMDNLTGKRFGRLLVTEFAGRGKQGKALWQCQCDCGNVVIIRAQALSAGRSGSCGCLRRDVSRNRYQTTHGMTKTAEYRVYLSAKYRCENPRDHARSEEHTSELQSLRH